MRREELLLCVGGLSSFVLIFLIFLCSARHFKNCVKIVDFITVRTSVYEACVCDMAPDCGPRSVVGSKRKLQQG